MSRPWKAVAEIDEHSFTSMSGSDIQPRSSGAGGGGVNGGMGGSCGTLLSLPGASQKAQPTDATVTAGTAAVVQVSPMTVYVPATAEILQAEIERLQAKLAAMGQCPDCEPPKVSPVADAIARTRYPTSMVEMALVRRPEFGG